MHALLRIQDATKVTMKRPSNQAAKLPGSASLLLDVIRFAAAIVVVIDHSGDPLFTTGWPTLHVLGNVAVPVFFVLSGFVIRFVTRTREDTLREYSIDRASRIYSIVLPSMALTILLTLACRLINPQRFAAEWAGVSNHALTRILANTLFFSQAWGHTFIPFINLPYWSMGYECIYYLFYGFLYFLRGWRRFAACLVLAIAIGPQVLFLLPLWYLGCWMYDLYQWIRPRLGKQVGLFLLLAFTLLAVVQSLRGSTTLLRLPLNILLWIANLPHPLVLIGIQPHRASMFVYATGLVAAVLLLPLLLSAEYINLPRHSPWSRSVRRVADGTFAIYLCHYPLLALASYTGLLRIGHTTRDIVVVSSIVIALILLAAPLDRLKLAMRSWLNAVISPAGRPSGPASFAPASSSKVD